MDVIIHALEKIGKRYDYIVILQYTSPYRNNNLIDDMIKYTIDNDYKQVVSVKQLKKEPNYIYYKGDDNHLVPLTGK